MTDKPFIPTPGTLIEVAWDYETETFGFNVIGRVIEWHGTQVLLEVGDEDYAVETKDATVGPIR